MQISESENTPDNGPTDHVHRPNDPHRRPTDATGRFGAYMGIAADQEMGKRLYNDIERTTLFL